MPHNSTQLVTHTITGGWATEYGDTHYASPDGSQIQIPWCNTLTNIEFNLDGSIGSFPGTSYWNTVPLVSPRFQSASESSLVKKIYSYTRMGASLSGVTQYIAVVGTSAFVVGTEITRIGDIVYPNNHPCLSTFNDLLIMSGNGLAPTSWDQTTFQLLAGSPPQFEISTSHAGRHWGAKIGANPSRLYYSAVGNPEDWVGAGSGSIDIDPGDGDHIVALLSWKKELWVFKGPNRLSIHRITGTSPSDFARTVFISSGVSAAGQDAIFQIGDDFAFWSPTGACHSLSATDTYGDYASGYLNFPILSWCRNNLDGGASQAWQTMTDHAAGLSYCTFGNTAFPEHTTYPIVIDWRFKSESNPYPRFYQLTFEKFQSVGGLLGLSAGSRLNPAFGSSDGFVFYKNQYSDLAVLHRDNPIHSTIEPAYLTYGPSYYRKTISAVSVDLVRNKLDWVTPASTSITVGGPDSPGQTYTFSTFPYPVVGTFTLGEDPLGPYGNMGLAREDVAAEVTTAQYTINLETVYASGNASEARIHHFSALVTPSGTSMELL